MITWSLWKHLKGGGTWSSAPMPLRRTCFTTPTGENKYVSDSGEENAYWQILSFFFQFDYTHCMSPPQSYPLSYRWLQRQHLYVRQDGLRDNLHDGGGQETEESNDN